MTMKTAPEFHTGTEPVQLSPAAEAACLHIDPATCHQAAPRLNPAPA